MPTVGHLLVGILTPLLIGYVLNKKKIIEISIYFLIGSILPDTYTIIKLFIFPDIIKYISINITHGFIIWIVWSYIFSIVLFFTFRKISKLQFIQIYYIILSAGWLHLGLDMMIQPVRIIGDFHLSIYSFYTSIMILEEQDFVVVFYVFFILIPIIILIIAIKK